MAAQHGVVRGDRVGLAVGVPQVGVRGGRPQRLARPRPTDEDRQPRLDRTRPAERIGHLVEPALVGHGLAVEQPADEPDRLVEPVEALPEPAAEIDAERVVLPLEPAAAEAEDRATARDVVERRGELRGQARVPERVGTDQQAESDAFRERGDRRRASTSPRALDRASRPRRRAGGRPATASPSRPARRPGTRRAGTASRSAGSRTRRRISCWRSYRAPGPDLDPFRSARSLTAGRPQASVERNRNTGTAAA